MTDKETIYNFNGFDWYELVTYFGLEQDQKEVFVDNNDFTVPEKATRVFFVGTQKICIETDDNEEVELIKLEKFLAEHLHDDSDTSKEVREVLNAFLDELIKASKGILQEDEINLFKAIRNINDNELFGTWFINNLRAFWN